jgi:hypothetical protein
MLALSFCLTILAVGTRADTVAIGTAAPFAVLGEAGVTNTGASVIFGNVAGSSGTPSVTGFTFSTSPGPGIVKAPAVGFTTGVANSGPGTPFGDATAAYGIALGLASTGTAIGAGGLSGATLIPGVYDVASGTFDLTAGGILVLNAQGSSGSTWTFIMSSSLITGSGSTVEVINAGSAGSAFTGSITWVAPSGATLGTTTTFLGTIISNAGDVIQTGATIGCGRVISLTASVSLDDNVIATPVCNVVAAGTSGTGGTGAPTASAVTTVPEPGTSELLLAGLAGLVMFWKARSAKPDYLRTA